MDLNRFTAKAAQALQDAVSLAKELRQQQVEPLHLFAALLRQTDGLVPLMLQKADRAPETVLGQILGALSVLPKVDLASDAYLSPEAKSVLEAAETYAGNMRDEFLSVEHVFLALLDAKQIQKTIRLDKQVMLRTLTDLRGHQRVTDPHPEGKYQALEKYCLDFTKLAREGKVDPVIGRDEEIRRIMQILSRRTKNNPVLVGEPGTGKTAIVEGLAKKIVDSDVPEPLKNKTILGLDLGALLAGTQYRGEFEQRLKNIIEEIKV